MVQGTKKEAMEMDFINYVPFCSAVYHIGLLMSLETNCVASSPEGVELLENDSIMDKLDWGAYRKILLEDSPFGFSTVEIMTLVSDTSLSGFVGRTVYGTR